MSTLIIFHYEIHPAIDLLHVYFFSTTDVIIRHSDITEVAVDWPPQACRSPATVQFVGVSVGLLNKSRGGFLRRLVKRERRRRRGNACLKN